MKAGRLDRRITIQRRAAAGKSASGEDLFSWVDVVTCWAEFVANRGQESFSAQQKQHETDAMFRIRHYPGIVSEMRIAFEGQNFDITAVIPMRGRNAGLELMAKEGLTNG